MPQTLTRITVDTGANSFANLKKLRKECERKLSSAQSSTGGRRRLRLSEAQQLSVTVHMVTAIQKLVGSHDLVHIEKSDAFRRTRYSLERQPRGTLKPDHSVLETMLDTSWTEAVRCTELAPRQKVSLRH